MGAPVSDQTAYRFRNDDGNETGATWKDIINTDVSVDVDTTFRLRIQVSETAGGNYANRLFKLQSNTGGAGWQDITTTSSNVKMVSSANDGWTITDDDPTTEQLAGSSTFTTGRYDDDGATETSITLDADSTGDTELEFCIQGVGTDLDNNNTTTFRVIETDNTPLNNYTIGYPQVTWVEAVVQPEPQVSDTVTVSDTPSVSMAALANAETETVTVSDTPEKYCPPPGALLAAWGWELPGGPWKGASNSPIRRRSVITA